MSGTLLQAKGLSVSYHRDEGDVLAVEDVNFSVASGSILVIIGASGAGKSSLALALSGLHDRSRVHVAGEILFQGNNIVDIPEDELDRLRGDKVGMIFQDPRGSLDPTMKVERQVAEAIRLHRDISAHDAADEARQQLIQAGVSDSILSKAPYAHQLSSGLCQRVMVAIALAGDPLLLIADEPTGSLDLTRQAQIISLLQQQVRENDLGMIFITHDLGIAAAIADQLLVMNKGSVIEYGSSKDVLAMPRHEHTAALINAWRGVSSSEGEQIATS